MSRTKFMKKLAMVAVGLGIGFGSVSQAEAALTGYWQFDNAGNLGLDSSASGNTLAPQGDAQYVAGGYNGFGGLLLDGNGDMLTGSPFPAIPTGNSDYTISAWIKPTASGSRGIVGWGNYGTTRQVNALRLNGANGFSHYWWGADISPGAGAVNLLDGNWHHVVAQHNGGVRQVWLDGSRIVYDLQDGTIGAHNAQPTNFAIGRTFGTEFFQGQLDEVAIWNEFLTDTQIRDLYTGVPANAIFPVNPLVALYRFNDASNVGLDSGSRGSHLGSFGNVAHAPVGVSGGALDLAPQGYLAIKNGVGAEVTNNVPLDVPVGDDPYTMAAWIKPDVTGDRGILGWGSYGAVRRVNALRLIGDNGFRHYWWGADLDASDAAVAGLGVDLDSGDWFHIAATYDGTTRRLWLNGLPLVSDLPLDHLVDPIRFRLGNTNGGENFDGMLDDVAIFRSALTQAEIQTIMRGDFTAYGVIPEPTTLGLLGLGVIGLIRRRR